ncbi:hypothetical protein DSCO28_08000 [Desulfosarcina ovata subsp. sediminis]|uniref:Uncharacterized protein n=1 Tax=Desulfosarcina ovata subsp. sediminis TaxID=885957 RepID=A0A5K7ZFY6_9BACT|nr:hypothetical protein DSCO28_08000 [Desulfosarcina ovata subsp. sediminis]
MREARPFLKQKRVEAESADSDKLENLKNFSFLLDYPVPSIEKTNTGRLTHGCLLWHHLCVPPLAGKVASPLGKL